MSVFVVICILIVIIIIFFTNVVDKSAVATAAIGSAAPIDWFASIVVASNVASY